MNYLISGATGLIGNKLAKKLYNEGNNITVIARNKQKAENMLPFAKVFYWEPGKSMEENAIFEGQDVIVHLAGEGVFGKRWNAVYKKKILESRVKSTMEIASIIQQLNSPPRFFVTASAIGIYGNRKEDILTEESKPGNDFLSLVCKQWEAAALLPKDGKTKNIILRIGNVLSADGGMLPKTLLPFKLFAGGALGSGKQFLSWIHEDDLLSIIPFVISKGTSGVFNCTAPGNETMNTYARLIGRILKRPSFFNVPQFILNLVVGEGAEYLTAGQRVQPFNLLKSGYRFKFTGLDEALINILQGGK